MRFLLTIVLFLSSTVPAVYADVIFNDGLVNTITSPINDRVRVSNNTTVIFNAGGNVATPDSPAVTVLDTSSVINNAGNLTAGGLTGGTGIFASDNATVSLFGGSVTGNPQIFGFDSGTGILALGNATVAIFGGNVAGSGPFGTGIMASGNATVSIFGGNIVGGLSDLSVSDNAVITLFGSGFNLPLGEVGPIFGTITGTLQDGTPIDFSFTRGEDGSGRIILAPAQVQVVPEPSGLALTGFGLFGLLASAWRCRNRAT